MRGAGLRTGVEGVEGEPIESHGVVIGQDPSAGEEVTRNDLITIYVGAPARLFNAATSPVDGDGGGASSAPEEVPGAEPVAPRKRKPSQRRGSGQDVRVGSSILADPHVAAGLALLERQPEPVRAPVPAPVPRGPSRIEAPPAPVLVHQSVGESYTDESTLEHATAVCEDESLLVSLPGAPRPTLLERWRSLPTSVRVASVLALVCVLTLATGGLTGSGRTSATTTAVRPRGVFQVAISAERRPPAKAPRRVRPQRVPVRRARMATLTPPPSAAAAPVMAVAAPPAPAVDQARGGLFSP